MKPLKLVFVFLFLLAACAQAFGQSKSLSPERKQLADQALKDRLSYAESKDYDPYSNDSKDWRAKSWEAVEKKDFKQALEFADRGLATNKYSIELLMAKAAAYRGLQDEKQADEYRNKWKAIVDSILYNGDGQSFKTAFKVINVDEEYAVMQILGLQLEQQSLQTNAGEQYDVMELKNAKTGATVTLYFNVDLPLTWLNRKLTAKAEKK